MKATEQTFTFDVDGSPLLAILHKPETSARTGVVMVVAGGPQYLAGCCRQLVLWARALSQAGIPVLRFDYRGMGDSGGEFKGFRGVDRDIERAIDTFSEHFPDIKDITLWGECNAASAIMMYAGKDPRIARMLLQNPMARSEQTQAKTYLKHYYIKRLLQKGFWQKLVHGKFNVKQSLLSFMNLLKKAKSRPVNKPAEVSDLPYTARMLQGLQGFSGKLLVIMSGKSLIGKEFDVLVSQSREWRQAMNNIDYTKKVIADADHVFSTPNAQKDLIDIATPWLMT